MRGHIIEQQMQQQEMHFTQNSSPVKTSAEFILQQRMLREDEPSQMIDSEISESKGEALTNTDLMLDDNSNKSTELF